MFIFVAILTLALVAYLTLRDWIRSPKISSHYIRKSLKMVSKHALLGNWQEAREELLPVLESGKGGKEAALLEVQVLRGTKEWIKALNKAGEAASKYPEELHFRLEEGLILLQLNKPREALDAFKVCAPIMRGETDIIALAVALNQGGYPEQAFELLEPWVESTQNGELIALAGETFFERKQFQTAIDFYYYAFQLGHKTHHLFTQLAHAYRRLGNLAESEKIFRKLLEKDPSDLTATLGLGACMQERGHFQKALLIYQSSGAWESKDTALLQAAGLCSLYTQKYPFAERYFFELIQSSEPDVTLYSRYALAFEGQRKWQEAEQIYRKMTQIFPSNPLGYRALAWMFGVGLTRTVSEEQGIRHAHIALKLRNDAVSWEILSACEARMGNFERAYQIQMTLASQDEEKEARQRRQQALRNLRKNHPLDDHHVVRSLVA